MLGGNASTLALVNSFRTESRRQAITARLVPLAWTPIGVVVGDTWQNVGIALDEPLRLGRPDLSARGRARVRRADARHRAARAHPVGMRRCPKRIDEGAVLNIEDVPEEVADGACASAAADRAMRGLPASRACATISFGKRSSCARGTTTRRSSESAARGATARTRNATSKRCPSARTSRRRCSRDAASKSCWRSTASTKRRAHA